MPVKQDLLHLFNWSDEFFYEQGALAISPVVHPRRRDADGLKLTQIPLSLQLVNVLVPTLAPWIPRMCQQTALSSLCFLQSGGHSFRTRKSLKPLLKSIYFTRLKMRPWLSNFRKRRCGYSSWRCLLDERDLRSTWWGDHLLRSKDYIGVKVGVRVPLRFFRYRSEYAHNYDLWHTYRFALLLLPIFLAGAPPDSQLSSIAAECIFNSFSTAHSRETRKAKKSIAQYLSRCRHLRDVSSGLGSAVDGTNPMDVD